MPVGVATVPLAVTLLSCCWLGIAIPPDETTVSSATAANSTSLEQRATQMVARLLDSYGSKGQYVHPGIGSSNFQVNMSFQLLHLYGLDENEVLEIGVWAAFLWTDPRLVWNASEFSGRLSVLKVPVRNIWLPDVGLSNTKKENQFDFRLMKTLEALVYPNGSVYIYYHLVTSVACPIDVTFFPFDSQVCDFPFGPWTSYRGSYRIHLPQDKIRMANISTFVSEWDLVRFRINPMQYFDDNVQQIWDYFEVKIELRRKPYYYLFVIVLPFFMLSITACLVFLTEGPGDKVNMSIAILLTMTLYIVITSSSSPKSMQTIPLLGIYIMVQMAVLILFTFAAIRRDFIGFPVRVREEPDGVSLNASNRLPIAARRLDMFLMSLYIGLTLVNVCVCMIVLPIAKRMM